MKRWLVIAALAVAVTFAPLAQAYDNAWTQVATVTLNAAYIDEAPVVVPVYLSGFDSTWWANVQADGDDIRVTEDDDTTDRSYYLVNINTGTQEGCIIVNTDGYASASVDKDLRVWVGNSGASAGSTTSTFTSTGYVGVWFPGESTSDASGGGRTLTAVNTPGTAAVSALEMDAATYDGSSQYHYVDSSPRTGWPVTSEAISSADNTTHLGTVVAIAVSSGNNPLNILSMDGTTGDAVRAAYRGDSGSISLAYSSASFSAATYTYGATSRDANTGTSTAYISGGSAGTNTTTITTPTMNRLSIGVLRNNSLSGYLDGNVAYAAVSDEVRSADYVTTMQDAFLTGAFRSYGVTAANTGEESTGEYYAGSGGSTTPTGDASWTSTANIVGSNTTTAATVYLEEAFTSNVLVSGTYGLAVPVDAEINSIVARVYRKRGSEGGRPIDILVQLRNSSGGFGSDKGVATYWSTTAGVATYTWTAGVDTMPSVSELNADTFGVGIRVQEDWGTGDPVTAYVYYVSIEVFYTPGAGGGGPDPGPGGLALNAMWFLP